MRSVSRTSSCAAELRNLLKPAENAGNAENVENVENAETCWNRRTCVKIEERKRRGLFRKTLYFMLKSVIFRKKQGPRKFPPHAESDGIPPYSLNVFRANKVRTFRNFSDENQEIMPSVSPTRPCTFLQDV